MSKIGQNKEIKEGGRSLGEGTGREDDREEERGKKEKRHLDLEICNVSKVEKSRFSLCYRGPINGWTHACGDEACEVGIHRQDRDSI
jgi:hypothetical protein